MSSNYETKADKIRRECRFYFCLIIGAVFMYLGFYAPPIGEIADSVLIGAGMFLCVGALAIGIDIKGCIHELRLLKNDAKK